MTPTLTELRELEKLALGILIKGYWPGIRGAPERNYLGLSEGGMTLTREWLLEERQFWADQVKTNSPLDIGIRLRVATCDLALTALAHDASREGVLEEWSREVRLIIRGIDAQAERLTHKEKTTWRDGENQGEREEDFEEIIHGYKLNTGLWHRLLGLLAACPAPEGVLASRADSAAVDGNNPLRSTSGSTAEPAVPQEKPWTAGPAFNTGAEKELSAAAPVPTPRSNAEERWAEWNGEKFRCVHVEFARQLERELGDLQHDLGRLMATCTTETNRTENAERELAGLRAALEDAATRMERARGILQDENSPWAMLDTVTIRAALKSMAVNGISPARKRWTVHSRTSSRMEE